MATRPGEDGERQERIDYLPRRTRQFAVRAEIRGLGRVRVGVRPAHHVGSATVESGVSYLQMLEGHVGGELDPSLILDPLAELAGVDALYIGRIK